MLFSFEVVGLNAFSLTQLQDMEEQKKNQRELDKEVRCTSLCVCVVRSLMKLPILSTGCIKNMSTMQCPNTRKML